MPTALRGHGMPGTPSGTENHQPGFRPHRGTWRNNPIRLGAPMPTQSREHGTRRNGASVSRRRRLEDGYCATPQPREPCGCGHGQFGQPLGGFRRSGRYDDSARSPKSAALFSRPRAATRISWRNATARKPLPGAILINLGRQCREEKEEKRSGVFSDRSRRKRLPTPFLCGSPAVKAT